MKKSNLIFLILILTSSVHAMDLRGFCFSRRVSLDQVENYLKQITAPNDIILKNTNKHCIEIGVAGNRSGLFDKFISMNYNVTSRYGGGALTRGRECNFEIENVKNLDRESDEYSIGKKNRLKKTQETSVSKSTSNLRVMEGKLAQLHVGSTLISLSCSGAGRVTEVSVSLGSKRTNIITTVQVYRGQRVNLGGIVDDLSNKERELSIKKGASLTKSKGKRTEEFYLILR
ncbi:hypothetical protein A9Q84_18490 [Halobacteriovorax marinus]|uniref:Flagella basal body P-ring formation protein FlgA n=1 Tax=Halobacteriovorax marinus TaxID=97084 RepID=A0A1Y5F2L1_9BACT|nr:hypothetical protein A9Q84_18490 [Halobacteriovorax marinus]